MKNITLLSIFIGALVLSFWLGTTFNKPAIAEQTMELAVIIEKLSIKELNTLDSPASGIITKQITTFTPSPI
jgi:hypothetical protein